MTEGTLWAWLRRARDHYGRDLHMRRVENTTSTGDPDVDGVLLGDAFAIELKACARPVKNGILKYHEVTPAQVEWHEKRQRAGGASAFLIQVGSGADASRYLVHGYQAAELAGSVTEQWLKVHGVLISKPADAVEYARLLVTPKAKGAKR